MALILSDNFNADTHLGGMTGWLSAPTGGAATYGVVEQWGQSYTTCAGCSAPPGQATRLFTPVTTGEGAIRCRIAAYVPDPPVDPTDGALILNIQNYAALAAFDDGYQTLIYLLPSGAFRIRYKTGAGTSAFQNTAISLFPPTGVWFGLQVRFTIGATNTVTFTVNDVDVATLTWAHTYVNTHYDNAWLYPVGTYTGGGPPITSMVLLDDYQLDDSSAAIHDWKGGAAPLLDLTRTCFDAPTPPTPPPSTSTEIRRQRVCLLPFDQNFLISLSRLELLVQAGVGTATGQGVDPLVIVEFSKDGGFTWGNEIQLSVGKIGEYARRCYMNRGPRARQLAVRITQTDPVFTAWLDLFADLEKGTS